MKRLSFGLTDPGLLRSVNQDAFHIDPNGRIFVVADGMGGHAGGQEASAIATRTILHCLSDGWDAPIESDRLLKDALAKANAAILADQEAHPERAEMGTTAVIAIVRHERCWFAHVGDSRLYLFRDSQLAQLTDDHTWIARALKFGDIDTAQARNHPWRHVLMQCLGRQEIGPIEARPLDVQLGDRLLLCSDGLTEELSDELIQVYLAAGQPASVTARSLVEAAKGRGGRDNITVVLVEFASDEEPHEVNPVEHDAPTLGDDEDGYTLGSDGNELAAGRDRP